jgi:hypothetical protein
MSIATGSDERRLPDKISTVYYIGLRNGKTGTWRNGDTETIYIQTKVIIIAVL